MKIKHPKVAQLLYSGLGGHAAVVFSIIDGDRADKWNKTIGFMGIEDVAPAYITACKERSIPNHYISSIKGKPWRSWPAFFGWLRATEPDALITHSSPTILPAWRYCSRNKIPLIIVEHTPPESASKFEKVCSALSMMLADKVVILTEEYRSYLQQLLGITYQADKVTLIANGIDIDHFSPRSQKNKTHKMTFKIGMAARFSFSKRQGVLIDALSILQRQYPDRDWQLSLAGDGGNYQAIVNHANGKESVHFEGMLSGQNYINWLRSLDIYCHASDGETLSTSILQAMGCALPIVATDIPGIRAQLGGEAPAGLLVEQSPEAFAEAIIRFAQDDKLRSLIAANARERIIKRYSHLAMFAAYDRIIGDLLNSP